MVCENHTNVTTESSSAPIAPGRAIGRRHSHISERPRQGAQHMTNFHDEMLQPRELEENWQDGANCLGVDPDLFFPERGASTREAKEVCRGCICWIWPSIGTV